MPVISINHWFMDGENMIGLTENEAKLLDYLIRHFDERNSINGLGRKLGITHTGAHKILRKLEGEGLVRPERIGNALYYNIDFRNDVAVKLAEFILLQRSMNSYAKVQADDLERIKGACLACILYGSVLRRGEGARDIDVMVVLRSQKDFEPAHEKLEALKRLKPKPIHDLVLTEADLIANIRKKDGVVIEILRTGQVLWGSDAIIGAIMRGTS